MVWNIDQLLIFFHFNGTHYLESFYATLQLLMKVHSERRLDYLELAPHFAYSSRFEGIPYFVCRDMIDNSVHD